MIRDLRPSAGLLLAIAALFLALGATGAPAAERGARRAKAGATRQTPKPDPCASYGPGFKMLPGTTTCMRIGGSIVGDFSSGAPAPNLGVK